VNDPYTQGFIDKCAEHGLDPVKLANSTTSMYGSFSPLKQGKQWGRLYGGNAQPQKQPPAQAPKPLFDQSAVQSAPYQPPPPARQVRETYAPEQ